MKKLAQAVVWIEIEKFGLDPQYVVLLLMKNEERYFMTSSEEAKR
ncbi:hypothetical protein [Segatella albensis]|nr:hypothetical protein [Segatella albensis]